MKRTVKTVLTPKISDTPLWDGKQLVCVVDVLEGNSWLGPCWECQAYGGTKLDLPYSREDVERVKFRQEVASGPSPTFSRPHK